MSQIVLVNSFMKRNNQRLHFVYVGIQSAVVDPDMLPKKVLVLKGKAGKPVDSNRKVVAVFVMLVDTCAVCDAISDLN
jgi:hypothetical protein